MIEYTLAGIDFVEVLEILGTAAINGTGNALANTIVGAAAANTLNGLQGADVLSGGAGADAFVFSTALGAGNIDRITDFSVVADTIRLDDAVFSRIAAGALAVSAFVANSSGLAADAADRIIYETDTGALWYDADGSGVASTRVQFATLSAGLALTSADFVVF